MTPSHHRPESASHPPERAARIRRIRHYAVPRPMIGRATERRLAGDWRGACAAAGVDPDFDLDTFRRRYGPVYADGVLDDLRHLVPDLVRWHFPRLASTEPDPRATVVLSRARAGKGPWLAVRTWCPEPGGSRRLALFLSHDIDRRGSLRSWISSRYLWDDRHVHETRERCGGGPDRAPFLNPDGTPRTVDELPDTDPGPGDPAARTEWIDHLHQTGRVAEALAAAGIDCAPEDLAEVPWLAALPLSPARPALEFSSSRVFGRMAIGPDSGKRLGFGYEGGRLRADLVEHGTRSVPSLPEELWERPPDIDALRDGMSPDHLHPLIRDALAPARPPADGPAGPPGPGDRTLMWTRCGAERHTVLFEGGRPVLEHTGEERRREAALRALGGRASGCLAVEEAWPAPDEELFERVRHGDTDALLRHLDSGGDPHVRDGEGNGLLHHLAHVDHGAALPRLLRAGPDIDAANDRGETPLGRAALIGGGAALLRALIGAGARTGDVVRHGDVRRSLAEVIEKRRYASTSAAEFTSLEEFL